MSRTPGSRNSANPSRSEAGWADSAAGGLPASGHGRISRRVGWRRLGAASDGDPGSLPPAAMAGAASSRRRRVASKNSANRSGHDGAVLVDIGHVNMHSPGAGPTIHDGRTASGPCAVISGVVSISTTSQLLESPISTQQRAGIQAPTANPGTASDHQTTGTSTLRQKVREEKPFRDILVLRRWETSSRPATR